MKLESMEIRKLYTNRFVLVSFILVFVLNLLTSYYIYQDQGDGKLMYSASSYKKLHLDIEDMKDEVANTYLLSYYEEIAEKYNMGETLELRYTDDYEKEIMLISDVGFHLEQCMNYQLYLDDIEDKINNNIYSGLSAISGEFSHRNMEQMRMDYEDMRSLSVDYGPSKGIELFSDMITTDFYVILFALVLVVQLITKERDSSQLALYKTTYHGHVRLSIAKLNVIIGSVVGMMLLLHGCNFIMGQQMYGFGDFGRQIQSVTPFLGCGLLISVWQYFILYFVAKVLIHICLSTMAFLIAVKASNSGTLYFILSILYGIGAICYYGISVTSRFSFFKYVNTIALLKSGDIIGKYQNLNILDMPYSYISVFFVVAILFTIIFVYTAIVQFDIQREAVVTGNRKEYKSVLKLSGNHFFLLGHEAHKLLFDGKLLVIILGYCICVLVLYKPASEEFYIAHDTYYNAYIEYVKGPITEATEEFLTRETEKFERLMEEYSNVENTEYYEYVLQPYQAFVQLRDFLTPYLKEFGGEYLHDSGYRLLTGDIIANNEDIKLGLLAVIVLIFPLSYIYGIEYQQNTIVLLKTTYYGRKRTLGMKLLLGVMTVTIIYVITYAPFYYSVLSEFGVESIHAPACSLQNLSAVSNDVSILQYLIFVAIFRYIGLISMMVGLFYVSSKTKSVIGTSLIGVLCVALPLVFAYLQVPGSSYLLLNPFIIGNVF